MKLQTFQGVWLAVAAAGWVFAGTDAAAQAPPVATNAPNISETSTPATNKPVQLSYGVADVLKLSQAQVGEDVILAYIANSGRTYNLSATEIVYLRGQGVFGWGVVGDAEPAEPNDGGAGGGGPSAGGSGIPSRYGLWRRRGNDGGTLDGVRRAGFELFLLLHGTLLGLRAGGVLRNWDSYRAGPRPAPPRVGPGPGRGLGRVQWS